jgi:hypothetical protein
VPEALDQVSHEREVEVVLQGDRRTQSLK